MSEPLAQKLEELLRISGETDNEWSHAKSIIDEAKSFIQNEIDFCDDLLSGKKGFVSRNELDQIQDSFFRIHHFEILFVRVLEMHERKTAKLYDIVDGARQMLADYDQKVRQPYIKNWKHWDSVNSIVSNISAK